MKTILMATLRKNGADVVLVGPESSLTEQSAKLAELHRTGSTKYSSAGVFYLTAKRTTKLSEPVKPENS